jgi:hypothetical protein
MKKFGLLFLTAAVFSINGQNAFSLSRQEDPSRLNQILSQTAEYCERVKSIALFYVCIENIKDKIYFYRSSKSVKKSPYGDFDLVPTKTLTLRRTRRHSYSYDYQLIKKGDDLKEQRLPLKKKDKKQEGKDVELEVRFSAKYLVYGPVGFLSRYWQAYFDYEIIGHQTIGETLSTIVRATPKPENEENRNFAQIWIDERDGSILQIEWEPESILDYEGKKILSQTGDLETAVVWRVTYGIEKNGVRFPSHQHVQEFLVAEDQKRYIRDDITTTFENYKFFVVETEIKNLP